MLFFNFFLKNFYVVSLLMMNNLLLHADINRVILKGQNRAFNGVMEEAAEKLLEVDQFIDNIAQINVLH